MGKERDSDPETTHSLSRTVLSPWISCSLLAGSCFTGEWTGVLALQLISHAVLPKSLSLPEPLSSSLVSARNKSKLGSWTQFQC